MFRLHTSGRVNRQHKVCIPRCFRVHARPYPRSFFPCRGMKATLLIKQNHLKWPIPEDASGASHKDRLIPDFSYFLGLELMFFPPSTSVGGTALCWLWWVMNFPGPAGPEHLTKPPCLSFTPLWAWAALIFPLEMKQQWQHVSIAKQECEPKPGKSSGDAWRGFVIVPQHQISHKPRPCHLLSAMS